MKKTKLIPAAAGLVALVMIAGSCGEAETVTGKEGMEKFVRDYYSNEHLVLTEMISDNSQTLAWFVSDSEMSGNQYEFIGPENVDKVADEIWKCFWHNGVSFYVNNQKCTEFIFSDNGSTMTSQLGEKPTSLFCNLSGADSNLRVVFKDKNGKTIH